MREPRSVLNEAERIIRREIVPLRLRCAREFVFPLTRATWQSFTLFIPKRMINVCRISNCHASRIFSLCPNDSSHLSLHIVPPQRIVICTCDTVKAFKGSECMCDINSTVVEGWISNSARCSAPPLLISLH